MYGCGEKEAGDAAGVVQAPSAPLGVDVGASNKPASDGLIRAITGDGGSRRDGWAVLTLVSDVWESCDPDTLDEIERGLELSTIADMKESHWTGGSVTGAVNEKLESSRSPAAAVGFAWAISGRLEYGDGVEDAAAAAAVALWCKSVISIAAVSRSTTPSLLASICSSAAWSMATDGFDGTGAGVGEFFPVARRLVSPWRGTPPSLAWTVRS